MKKHEIIGLLLFIIISTIYSFNLPDDKVENIESKMEITINVEGLCNQKLIFDYTPSINDIFNRLQLNNEFGFDENIILTNQSLFYIPINSDNLISLNKANKEELMTIKGIGDKTADKIIEYRNDTPFNTIEDIMKISGIGEKTYLKIRELLCL